LSIVNAHCHPGEGRDPLVSPELVAGVDPGLRRDDNWVCDLQVGGAAMPRVSEIEEDSRDPVLKKLFEKERAVFGGVLNTTKVMAHCPPILRAAKLLGASIEQSGQLPRALVPLVSLRVAAINGCPF
jgi:hypothetical protein